MLAFAFRRTLQSFPTVAAVALVVFVLFSVIPGSIATSMSDDGRGAMDAEVVERMRKELGLDDPLYLRFATYVSKLAVLDLGLSFRSREPVSQLLAKRLWPTMQLVLASMGIAIVIGVPLGFVAAMRPGGAIDAVSMVMAVSGLSIPKFWFGAAVYLFALKLGWFPTFVTGLVVSCASVTPRRLAIGSARGHDATACWRSSPDSCSRRSKGMSGLGWCAGTAAHVAVIVRTTLGLRRGVDGSAVVVEKKFSWPCIGSLLVDSVFARDIPAVQGCILLIVLFFLVVNTLVDIACAAIDPRIKYT